MQIAATSGLSDWASASRKTRLAFTISSRQGFVTLAVNALPPIKQLKTMHQRKRSAVTDRNKFTKGRSLIDAVFRYVQQQLNRFLPAIFTLFCIFVTAWTGHGFVQEFFQLYDSWYATKSEALITSYRDIRVGTHKGRAIMRTEFTCRSRIGEIIHEFTTRELGPFADPDAAIAVLKSAHRDQRVVQCVIDVQHPDSSYFLQPLSITRLIVASLFPIGFGVVGCLIARPSIKLALRMN